MTHLPLAFRGKSGHLYDFVTYELASKFAQDHGGVYIVTNRHEKPDGKYGHHVLDIGATEDFSSEFATHEAQSCLNEHEANCVCVHAADDPHTRQRIMQDLLGHYDLACNQE
jgi:hypothetical protein